MISTTPLLSPRPIPCPSLSLLCWHISIHVRWITTSLGYAVSSRTIILWCVRITPPILCLALYAGQSGGKAPLWAPIWQKLPLARSDLEIVQDALPLPLSHDNILFLVQLFDGFYGLLHLGELVWLDNKSIQSVDKVTLCTSIVITDSYHSFLLRHHKSDVQFKGNTIVIQHTESADPHHVFTLCLEMLVSLLIVSSGSTLMGPSLHMLGSFPGCALFSLILYRGIHCKLGEPLLWWRPVSHKTVFRQLAAGLVNLSGYMFAKTLPLCMLS